MLPVMSAHILIIHHLAVEFTAKKAPLDMQLQQALS